tara:strand:+ start:28 stop:327 length:300 start_codon:yes stop_codon:yes gene_type:complete
MDELDVMLRKNKLDIMIIKASAEVEKTNNKVKQEGLEVLMDILELIHDLQHQIREDNKLIGKLKYENAVAYKENAILKADFSKYKHNLIKVELNSDKNG